MRAYRIGLRSIVGLAAWGALGLAACSSDSSASPQGQADAASDTSEQADADAGLPPEAQPADGSTAECGLPSCTFGELSPWQEPIADYMAAVDTYKQTHPDDVVNTSIDDLIVFDERLFIGYGDATVNMGRVTDIAVKSWLSPEATEITVEFPKTDEEEIEHYRAFGDTLYISGVDATEDAFLGNAFTRPKGGTWTKHRSINGGVHVHDIVLFKGDLYACGSGALTLDDWNTSKVHSYLWRSQDQANTWAIAGDMQNTQIGDRRWVRMVPFPEELLIFGYRSNSRGSIVELLSHRWDGAALTAVDPLPSQFVLSTELLDSSTALVNAVLAKDPLHFNALRLTPGQPGTVIDELADKTVLDAAQIEPGKMIVLVTDGITYPLPSAVAPIQVLVTSDLVHFTELLTATLPVWPTSVAYWKGGIYVGLGNAKVYRSLPKTL